MLTKEEISEHNKYYYQQNKKSLSEKKKLRYAEHKEELQIYRNEHKEEITACHKLHYEKNKANILIIRKLYRKEHAEAIHAYFESNREIAKKYASDYRINNHKQYIDAQRKWRDQNKEKMVVNNQKNVLNITISYLSTCLKISTSSLQDHPDFIQAYKQQLLTKRLLRHKKHENTKSS